MARPEMLAAIASGILLALPFHWPACYGLAFVALVPLLLHGRRRPWRSGLLAGTVFYALVLYWINLVMVRFGQLPWALALPLYLLLVLYLAGFWGAACWCCERLRQRLGLTPLLLVPVVWLVAEYGRSWLLTGFPWGNPVYALMGQPLLLQSADLAGLWLPLALLLLVNALVAQLWTCVRQHRPWPRGALLLTGLLLLANSLYGVWRGQSVAEDGEPLRVALIQGNIDQDLKWNPAHLEETLQRYENLSRQAPAAALLVWPESATPFFYQSGGAAAERVRQLARQGRQTLLFGSPAYDNASDGRRRYLNSAFAIDSEGRLLGRSDKVHLVPFGEYVPLARLLTFVDKLAEGIGDFMPGQMRPLPLAGVAGGVLICYEAIFPELARQQVAQGAQLLVNLTNDAWFGRTAAPWQHLAMARLRAIENRRYLVRSANSGISAIIDPAGRLLAHSPLFVATSVEGVVYGRTDLSLYSRLGDLVPRCLTLVVLLWLWQSRRSLPAC